MIKLMIKLMIQFTSKRYGFENRLGFVSMNKLNFHHSHIVLLILLIDLPDSSKSLQGLKKII